MIWLLFISTKEEMENLFESVNYCKNIIYHLAKYKLKKEDIDFTLNLVKAFEPTLKLNKLWNKYVSANKNENLNSTITFFQTGADLDLNKTFEDLNDLIEHFNDVLAVDLRESIKAFSKDGFVEAIKKLGFEIKEIEEIINIIRDLANNQSKLTLNDLYKKLNEYFCYDLNDLYNIVYKVINNGNINLNIINDEIIKEIRKIVRIPFNIIYFITKVLDGILKPFYKIYQQDEIEYNVIKFKYYLETNFKNDTIIYSIIYSLLRGLFKNGTTIEIFSDYQDIIDFLALTVTPGGIRKLLSTYFGNSTYYIYFPLLFKHIDNKTLEFSKILLNSINQKVDDYLRDFTVKIANIVKISKKIYIHQNLNNFNHIFYILDNFLITSDLTEYIIIIKNAIDKIIPTLEPLLGPFYKIIRSTVNLINKLITSLIINGDNFEDFTSNLIAGGKSTFKIINAFFQNLNDISKIKSPIFNLEEFLNKYIDSFGIDFSKCKNFEDINRTFYNDFSKYQYAMYKLCLALEETELYNIFPIIKYFKTFFSKAVPKNKETIRNNYNYKVSYEFILKAIAVAGDVITVNVLEGFPYIIEKITDCARANGDAISFGKEIFKSDFVEIIGNLAIVINTIKFGSANSVKTIQESFKIIEMRMKNNKRYVDKFNFKDFIHSTRGILDIIIVCFIVFNIIVIVVKVYGKKNEKERRSSSKSI